MHLLGGGVAHDLLPPASLVTRVCDASKRCIPDFSPLRIVAGLVSLMVMQQPQQQAVVVEGIKDDVVKLVAIKGDDDDDDDDDTNKNNNRISAGDIETCAPWLLQSIVSCAQVVFRCLGSSSGNIMVAQVRPHAAALHVVR